MNESVSGVAEPTIKEDKELSDKAVGVAPIFVQPKQGFFELRARLSKRRNSVFAILGAILFFGAWEITHYMMDETQQRFLPSVEQVIGSIYYLLAEKNFIYDILKSCYRVYVSFFAACLVAVPIAVVMGVFKNSRALLNPTLSAARYLPAASFIPLLLVWFGPTDLQKMALLWLGVVFFLIALILDNTESVPEELIEASQTMGASRTRVLFGIVFPAAAPAILDSMRAMIAVSWTYLVIAEIVAAQDGIGAVMMRAGRFLNVDIIMAGILTIGLLGVLTDVLFRTFSYYLFPWMRARKG